MVRLAAPLGVFALVLTAAAAPAAAPDVPPQTAFINTQIAAKWKEADIQKPAARATDDEYLRRTFLDILGRIATPAEVLDFERDRSADKRVKLVRRLLYETKYVPRPNGSPVMVDSKTPLAFDYADEYARHWAGVWTVWLMSRSVHDTYRQQMRYWLETEIKGGTNHRDMVAKILTASGKSNANGAVNFIAQQLGEMNPRDRRDELGTFDAVPVTSRVTRLFLGLQTQCTQCHDHPFNKEWVQSDFWGVNAFFRQVERDGTPTRPPMAGQMAMALQQVALTDSTDANPTGLIYYERRDGQMKAIKPLFLKDVAQANNFEKSEKYLDAAAGSRREALAKFVVTHDNFTKAYVNRIWGHLFGRGLNRDATIDDFGSHNEVVHPELLAGLAAEFAKYEYDPKRLLEWICLSDAYQLSHVADKAYADPKYNAYFARMPLKALSPEVLYQSIGVATKSVVPNLPSPNAPSETKLEEAKKVARERWLRKLVQQFGDDEGNEITFNGTVVQALLMMNGRELNDEIGTKGASAVYKVVVKHTRSGNTNVTAVLDDLFLMTLNRHPSPAELSKLKSIQSKGVILNLDAKPGSGKPTAVKPGTRQPWKKGADAPELGVVYPSAPSDVTFYQDVFWALLNTNEFMLNH